MAAIVQSAQNAISSTSSITVTLGSPTTAGNALVAMVLTVGTNDNGSVSGITLGGSADHWASETNVGTTTSHALDSCWSDPNCTGGQTSVVISTSGVLTGTQVILAWVYEVSGMPTTGPLLDQSATLSSSGFVTSWTLGPTSTTTQASEVWFAIAGGNTTGTSPGTFTGPSSPWVNESSQGVSAASYSPSAISGYQIASSTGTASYNGSVTPSSTIEGLLVTLKASASTTSSGSVAMARPAVSGTGISLSGSGTVSAATSTLAATGTVTMVSTGSVAAPVMALAAAAGLAFSGAGSMAEAVPALTGTAGLTLTGSGSVSSAPMALASSGTLAIAGAGSAGVSALSIAANADQGLPISSSGTITVPGNGISASGYQGQETSNLLMLGFI